MRQTGPIAQHSQGSPGDREAGAKPTGAERRQSAERPRRAVDCRVAAVLESVTHGFLALDAEWRVTYANAAAMSLSGHAGASLVGRSHWEVWPETVGTDVERRYREVVAEGRSAHFEHHYAGRDVWHEIHAFPTDDGGVAIVYRDVTEEHAAAAARDRCAAALAVRERELAMILETASDAVVRFDRELRVTFANAAVSRATGVPPDELLGRTPAQLGLAPELVARCRAQLRALLDAPGGVGAGPRTLVFQLETAAGVRWFEAQGVAEPGPDGTASAVLVVARDATIRVAAERQLERALALAESANATKSRFLATMSHELRTPLNAIRGFTELLEIGVHGPVNDSQRECLARIRRSEEHLLALISDILDHARIEAGRMRYEAAPVPVDALVDDVLAWMGRHADAARVTLDSDACTAWARGDSRRVRQVLVNLVSNAVKFTPPGGAVRVHCRAPAPTAPGAMVTVDVVDTGPGVPAEARERVFEPFEQLGRSRRSPVAGVGLGLAISRELARGMGGDLTVEDAPGGGACFRLTLRASAPPIPRRDPAPVPAGS